MLENDRVTEHQIRCREAGDLVVREVPRHDADESADRSPVHNRLLGPGNVESFFLEQCRTVVCIPLIDRGRELYFALGLADRLTHLQGDRSGQFVCALCVQFGGLAQDCRTLLWRTVAPGQVAAMRVRKCGFNSGVIQSIEFPDGFTCRGIDCFVISHSCTTCGRGSKIPETRNHIESAQQVSIKSRLGTMSRHLGTMGAPVALAVIETGGHDAEYDADQ